MKNTRQPALTGILKKYFQQQLQAFQALEYNGLPIVKIKDFCSENVFIFGLE